MSGSRIRRLSDAEIEVWLKVAETVTPRHGASLPEAPRVPAVPVAKTPEPEPKRPPSSMPGYSPPVSRPRQGGLPLVPFEKRFRQQVTRGAVEIDRAMDLHGLTQAKAFEALHGFLRSSQVGGARLVLVVTGKGRTRISLGAAHGPVERETGILRRLVPMWLRAPELRSVVLGFEEASLPHGGLGALYVRLRKAQP